MEEDEPEAEMVDAAALPSGANCDQFTFVLYVFVLGAICLFGLVGNTLSFLVLRSDRRVHVATFLLQVIAVKRAPFYLSAIKTQRNVFCYVFFVLGCFKSIRFYYRSTSLVYLLCAKC